MNPLEKYISVCGSQAEAARRLGVSESYMSLLAHKQRKVSHKMAILIEKDTNGLIKKEDIVFANCA